MNANLRSKMALWGKRFFPIADGLAVSLAAVLSGDAAKKMLDARWPEGRREARMENPPGILRLWLEMYYSGRMANGEIAALFSGRDLMDEIKIAGLALTDAYRFEWQFMRLDDELVKAVACRRSEIATMTERGLTPPLWGFGRPHPWRTDFKPHTLFAGPLVDFSAGKNPYGPEPFVFEPVLIRVASKFEAPDAPAHDYALELSSKWAVEDGIANGSILLTGKPLSGEEIPPCLAEANLVVK